MILKEIIMATIKSFTSLEQSRKLAEILPLESADMWWAWYSSPLLNGYYGEFPMFCKPVCNPDESVPCWSLAALLNMIPNYKLSSEHNYHTCTAETPFGKETVAWFDNPVDACVAMIEKLYKLKLL